MLNSDRFLARFSAIERHLRMLTGSSRHIPFYRVLEAAVKRDLAVDACVDDLREFADLRNAIVHERSDNHVIAEPNDEAVADIERIAELLLRPPRVDGLFVKSVVTLAVEQTVADAVSLMYHESFSQIPLYAGTHFAALLTANTVTRWLGNLIEQDIFSLAETPLRDLIPYNEDIENYCFLPATATVFEVIEVFEQYERRGRTLDAILISDAGEPAPPDKLRGIITYWDLNIAYRNAQPRRHTEHHN